MLFNLGREVWNSHKITQTVAEIVETCENLFIFRFSREVSAEKGGGVLLGTKLSRDKFRLSRGAVRFTQEEKH